MRSRKGATWVLLLLGFGAAAHTISVGWPRENRLVLDLPKDGFVDRVHVEIADLSGEVLRDADLRPPPGRPRNVEYVLSLPPGLYRLTAEYNLRGLGDLDKNHVGGWTRVGSQHQIRLEGEDHRFPPPKDEAK